MDVDEARSRMLEIQRIMERATLCTLLPGAASIIGGLLVLAGCAASYAMFRSLDFGDIVHLSFHMQVIFCFMWFGIGALALVIEVIFMQRAAKQQNLVPNDRPMRVAAFSLTPSVVVAMVLTIKFLIPAEPKVQEIQYIVPVWMMLYGTGVYTAGLFSIRPPRVLGILFLLLGVIALLAFPQYGVVSAAVSFGLLHIVFGGYILARQRQERTP
jgi:hypothetical protein